MKDVYQKTPQMGDPNSLEPKISETLSNIERLRLEIQKYEVRTSVVVGRVAREDGTTQRSFIATGRSPSRRLRCG